MPLKGEFENRGVDRILKLFEDEGRYLAQLNDVQANQLLNNLKTANKIVNPPPKPEAGIYQFSKLPGKKLTPDEYTGKKAVDEGKLHVRYFESSYGVYHKSIEELAKRLNLDMSKAS